MISKTIKLTFLLFVTISITLTGASASRASDATNVAVLQKTVATVNGLPIYEDVLKSEMNRIVNKGWTTGMAGNSEKSVSQRKAKALDTIITSELIRQASQAHTTEDIDNKISQQILEMKKKYPTEEDFSASLKRKNKTIESIRTEAKNDIQLREYINNIKTKDIQISDSSVEKFYNENRISFTVPEQIKVRHILVKIEGSSVEQLENASKKAYELREQVLKLKDFATVAKESSACASAKDGGELQYISRGNMPAEFDKVAFTLRPGEISNPVKTLHGIHIIELLDRKPEFVRPLKEVNEFITTYLKQQAGSDRLKSHIIELKNKAKIEIVPD